MAAPPPPTGPWYTRRPWGYGYGLYGPYAGRPYAGCGCLYTIVLIIAVWFLVSLFVDALRWY